MNRQQQVLKANIDVHTAMVERYESEPHWRPENIEKVRRRLKQVMPIARSKALDVGAGTGFLTRLIVESFDAVSALDATPAMLQKIPKAPNLEVFLGQAEDIPFPNNTFDFVCAYSFLHHLYEPEIVLREMIRVLKPGGTLYVDLEPNTAYWSLLRQINNDYPIVPSPTVKREIEWTLFVEEKIEKQFSIPEETFALAEYSKSISGGFNRLRVQQILSEYGLSDVSVNLDWFMGEGKVFHGESPLLASKIGDHLQSILPASEALFKYLWFTGRKE